MMETATVLPDEWRDLPTSTGLPLRPIGTIWHAPVLGGVHTYRVSEYMRCTGGEWDGGQVVEVSSFVRPRPVLAAVAEEGER